MKTIPSRADPTVTRSVTFLVYSCPKEENRKDGAQYCFEKGAGFFNPYRHLRSCLAGGDTEKLYSLYHDALKEIQSRNCNHVIKYFPATMTFTNSEKALYGYIQYILMLGNPISHIESPIVRNFSKYDTVFDRKFFTNCLLELVKIVECNIAKEMKHVK